MRLVINKHSFSIKETKSTNYGLLLLGASFLFISKRF